MSPFLKLKVELWHQYSSRMAWNPKVMTKFVQDCKTTTTAWKVSVFGDFLVWMLENTDYKSSKYEHFERSVLLAE